MWDYSIQTDQRGGELLRDIRIEEKEKEKIEKYEHLSDLQTIWNERVNIIPLAMGYLGVIPKQFRLKETGITVEIG